MTEIEKELNRRADIIIRQEKQIQIDAEQIRALQKQNGELTDKVKELEAQIEEMKFDVKANIKWADEHKNNQMYFKLNSMFNQWEIKENE